MFEFVLPALTACDNNGKDDQLPTATIVGVKTNATQRPNIPLIVAGGLGYFDIGTFGDELNPQCSQLFEKGMRFST